MKHSENGIDADFPLFEGKRLNPVATITLRETLRPYGRVSRITEVPYDHDCPPPMGPHVRREPSTTHTHT
ncbi:hypothetical protein BDI4_740020 [Burkholderia diffusa]|nr:hypothetical protein BDI4_740020 [Burkholderia diffusa]